MNPFILLFVCTGNICRSPMAEGIMNDLILDEVDSHGRNIPIKVMSAGTHAVDGSYPSENAVKTASQHGIDIGFHRSRHLSEEIVNDADIILTMDKNHTNLIKGLWTHVNYVFELKKFGLDNDNSEFNCDDIIDPIGMGLDVYISVFNEMKNEILRVSQKILSLAEKK